MPKPALLLLMSLPAALAQTPPPEAAASAPAKLEAVQVELVRDPAAMPYARMNELLTNLKTHGQGLFAMDFRLDQKNKDTDPKRKPKLAIAYDEGYLPISFDAEGRFELPLLPPEQAKSAELASNLPRGSVGLNGRVRLTTPPAQLTMGQVRRIMATAGTLRSELLPWYLRWMFPQIGGVRICSAEPRWELEWRENGQLLGLPLVADPKDRDPEVKRTEKSPPCTTLTGAEAWPDAARLVAPADARLSVRLGLGT